MRELVRFRIARSYSVNSSFRMRSKRLIFALNFCTDKAVIKTGTAIAIIKRGYAKDNPPRNSKPRMTKIKKNKSNPKIQEAKPNLNIRFA